MSTGDWLAIVITLVTIILTGVGYFLKRIVDNTDKISEDIADIKPKVKVLWEDKFSQSHSPRQLNTRGLEILEESGIKKIVESQKDKLFDIVKSKNPNNPYDAEKEIMTVMEELPEHCPEVVDQLKTGAFNTGVTPDVLLYVGGLYLRNLIFIDLGFSLTDLDKR